MLPTVEPLERTAGSPGALVDQDQRACPSCGAENPTSAQFCWQCYAPFGRPGPGPGQAPPAPWISPRMPSAWIPPPPPSPVQAESSALGKLASRIAAALVAAALVAVGFWWFGRSDVSMPESFGGLTKYTSSQTDSGVDVFRSYVKSQGIEGDMAFYASSGIPRAALIWVRDPTTTDTQSAFDEFASGFGPSFGGSTFGQTETKDVNGVSYLCAAVSGPTSGALCMWRVDDVFWVLLDTQGTDVGAARDLAVQARTASS